jgi:4-amino-4-deoxy-L-arabinose transferase-like glycosyltransferase
MRRPPRALVVALFVALTILLVYPVHRPYLHPDQDLPVTLPLFHMAQPTFAPRIITLYGSAHSNLMHLVDAVALRVGRIAGCWDTPVDLLIGWCHTPWPFRVAPRLISMAAGLASLMATYAMASWVVNGWLALVAPAVLGTWLMFVREHHHGLYDAPGLGCAMLSMWAAGSHVRAPSTRRIVIAGSLAGLAASFKYNLALTVPAIYVAALALDRGWRMRTVAIGTVTAIVTFLLTSPEIVVDHLRWWTYLVATIPLLNQAHTHYAGPDGNRLLENLLRGVGWIGLGLAGAGVVAVATRVRERSLLPILTFGALYAVVLLTAPLAVSRYILPITAPLALLVVLALSQLPGSVATILSTIAVVVGLPACIQYVRLLAIEDTRIEAARLVEQEWARGGRVVFATSPVFGSYVDPDIAQLPRYDPGLSESALQAIATAAPRCTQAPERLALPQGAAGSEALRAYAGALVVTADPPAPEHERASTRREVTALLEREATLVTDLEVSRVPVPREYEVFDLNLVPFTGLASLLRPGPRLRFWRVPAG